MTLFLEDKVIDKKQFCVVYFQERKVCTSPKNGNLKIHILIKMYISQKIVNVSFIFPRKIISKKMVDECTINVGH